MKAKHIILTLLLVAVVFFGTIFLFLYKSFDTNSGGDRTPFNNVPTNNQQGTTTPTSTPPQSNTTPVSDSDEHSAINDCVELKSHEAQGKQYERGSLLVSFFNSVDYNLAVEIIRLLGLRAESSSEARANFNQNHWLTVTVPSGKEFEWQCQLDASEGVKKANLNLTFNLRQ